MESLNDYWHRMQLEQRELEKQRQQKFHISKPMRPPKEPKEPKKEVIEVEKLKYIDISARNEQLILKHRKDMENARQVEKRGIERFFIQDLNDPVDVRIMQRLTALGKDDIIQQERFCKVVLAKQLLIDADLHSQYMHLAIEQKIHQYCQKNGKERNDYVRELFCTHFRIRPVAPK